MTKAGVPLVALLAALGTFWAYQRGGHDFDVFYFAWKLVLQGRGLDIYANSPDRYLYAPGFAWVLAPLGLLPKGVALAVWSFLEAWVLALLIRAFAFCHDPVQRKINLGLCSCAALVMTRAILINFQYGQINLLILGVCVWALWIHLEREGRDNFSPKWKATLAWFLLGVVAVSKIFALPLLLLPWFRTEKTARANLFYERVGSIAGVLTTLLIPVVSVGWNAAYQLLFSWRDALLQKGLPEESHNQSFVAFLNHYFTAAPTHVIALGHIWRVLGHDILSPETISLLSLAWTFAWMGVLLVWLLKGSLENQLRWIAVSVALLIVPSHLVWKPYFVFSIPLAMVLVLRKPSPTFLLFAAFALINLTSFDLIGGTLAGYIEAASVFLWVHLVLLAAVMKPHYDSNSL
jgi:hypothetical protein